MENYSITINNELAQRAFDFGRKLGLLDKERFEEVFPEKILQEINGKLPEYIDGEIVRIRSFPDRAIARVQKEISLKYFLESKRKLLTMREMLLGEKIVDIAVDKKLAKRIWGFERPPEVYKHLSQMTTELDISCNRYEDNEATGQRTMWVKINGEEIITKTEPFEHYNLWGVINDKLEEKSSDKRFVFFEGIYDSLGMNAYGIMLINKAALKLEDNPFIPFYYENNLQLLYKQPVSQKERDEFDRIMDGESASNITDSILKELSNPYQSAAL